MDAKIFVNELSIIESDVIREGVVRILSRMSERNAIEPASSTGKYHPDFAHGEGGLIRHTKAVVLIANELCNTRPDLCRDHIIAAAILHDMFKYDDLNQHTLFPHPQLMANECDKEDMMEVGAIIASHMGQWNKSKYSSITLDTPSSDSQWLLHYADYIASRTWLHLNFIEGEIHD